MKPNFKTNAMRILDAKKIEYKSHQYSGDDGAIDGISVAAKMGMPTEQVFKTLVTQAPSKQYYVFVIPVAEELDLKAAAKAVGEKAVEMIKVADINKVTGYIRGGCSPIGMKKFFKTVIHTSVRDVDTFFVSAGKIGYQLELTLDALSQAIPFDICDIIHH